MKRTAQRAGWGIGRIAVFFNRGLVENAKRRVFELRQIATFGSSAFALRLAFVLFIFATFCSNATAHWVGFECGKLTTLKAYAFAIWVACVFLIYATVLAFAGAFGRVFELRHFATFKTYARALKSVRIFLVLTAVNSLAGAHRMVFVFGEVTALDAFATRDICASGAGRRCANGAVLECLVLATFHARATAAQFPGYILPGCREASDACGIRDIWDG